MSEGRSSLGARVVTGLAVVAVGAGAAFGVLKAYPGKPSVRVVAAPAPKPKPPADTLADPLAPERVVRLDPTPRASASTDWVTAHPGFQYSRSSAQRGGVNPCAMPDADASAFEPWTTLSKGHFTAPRAGALDGTGGFDLVLFFHGDELARRELVESGQKFVLYALTLDASESYSALFAGTKLMPQLVAQIEQLLGAAHGVKAQVRHVALAAWSAGYMAVLSILVQPEAKDVDAVVLADGLHGQRGALERQLTPFVEFARRAEAGERFMLVTHSSIDPPGFASTTESVHYLLSALGERPQAVRRDDRVGLELVEYFSHGDFHVRGYAGNDKADHCAQVTLLRDGFAALGRRWQQR